MSQVPSFFQVLKEWCQRDWKIKQQKWDIYPRDQRAQRFFANRRAGLRGAILKNELEDGGFY